MVSISPPSLHRPQNTQIEQTPPPRSQNKSQLSQDVPGKEEVCTSSPVNSLHPLTKDAGRLEEALAQVRATSPPVTFTLHFEPFQLFPDFPDTADKQEWYLHEKHFDNEAAQQAYQSHMTSLLEPHGVKLNFAGKMGNTLHAHRVIQQIQRDRGADAASRLVEGLYRRYFEQAKHPSADETLVEACMEAGVGEDEARKLVEDKEMGLREVSARLREVTMDADAVPVVAVEGKRRDITLTGAKEVKDYIKALETVVKESG